MTVCNKMQWEKQREYLLRKPIAAFHFYSKISNTLNALFKILFLEWNYFSISSWTQRDWFYTKKKCSSLWEEALQSPKVEAVPPCLTNCRHENEPAYKFTVFFAISISRPHINVQPQEPLSMFLGFYKDQITCCRSTSLKNSFSYLRKLFSFLNVFCR